MNVILIFYLEHGQKSIGFNCLFFGCQWCRFNHKKSKIANSFRFMPVSIFILKKKTLNELQKNFRDPNLCKILIKCFNEKHTEDIETTTVDEKNICNVSDNQQQQPQATVAVCAQKIDDMHIEECLLCSEKKRDTVFKPCGHVVACEACGSRIKKCLICRETVLSREKVRFLIL